MDSVAYWNPNRVVPTTLSDETLVRHVDALLSAAVQSSHAGAQRAAETALREQLGQVLTTQPALSMPLETHWPLLEALLDLDFPEMMLKDVAAEYLLQYGSISFPFSRWDTLNARETCCLT